VDSIDTFRAELEQIRAVCISLRGDVQELRKSVEDLRADLRGTSQEKRRARIDPRDRAAAELIRRSPRITSKEFCRGMNLCQERKPDCGPLPGWGVQVWTDMLHRDKRNALYQYLHRKKRLVLCITQVPRKHFVGTA
jgi:hypothetical protein